MTESFRDAEVIAVCPLTFFDVVLVDVDLVLGEEFRHVELQGMAVEESGGAVKDQRVQLVRVLRQLGVVQNLGGGVVLPGSAHQGDAVEDRQRVRPGSSLQSSEGSHLEAAHHVLLLLARLVRPVQHRQT